MAPQDGPREPFGGERLALAVAELYAALRAELQTVKAETAQVAAQVQELRAELQEVSARIGDAAPVPAVPAVPPPVPPVLPDAGLQELLQRFDALREQLADRGVGAPPDRD
jgi:hypothetical protein